MKRVYVAHPLMGRGTPGWDNPEENFERYLRFCAMCSNMGNVVVSWAHHYLMHKGHLTFGDASYYLERDRKLLEVSDELWLCGPPGVSNGVAQEVTWAAELGIPIVFDVHWVNPLCKWARHSETEEYLMLKDGVARPLFYTGPAITKTQAGEFPAPHSCWKHFKGGVYTVEGYAAYRETGENLIIYSNERGELWARPATMWFDHIDRGGYSGPSFTRGV